MEKAIIKISGAVASNSLVRMKAPVSFTLINGESIAIVGENGAGKSLLTQILLDAVPLAEGEAQYDFSLSRNRAPVYENVAYIAFLDAYGSSGEDYYYQQRWNAGDTGDFPTAGEILGIQESGWEINSETGMKNNPPGPRDDIEKNESEEKRQERDICKEKEDMREDDILGIRQFADKKLIYLSSGELRKFRIALALKKRPRVLMIDNPFIGLDAESREEFGQMLGRLSGSVSLILMMPVPEEIPAYITHVTEVKGCETFIKYTRQEYVKKLEEQKNFMISSGRGRLSESKKESLLSLEYGYNAGETFYTGSPEGNGSREIPQNETPKRIIKLNDVSIRYGNRTILDKVNWTVYEGERWALRGSNGSGKSTLINLITADNPQSYACDIELFGRPRGSGESIWDIKKRIGYVSPEMHRAFGKNVPSGEIVASGLLDTMGLYVKVPAGKIKYCDFWMNMFGIGHLKEKPFLKLSSGEQRLVLLARAFVKDPDLLILDEPMHGLDLYNKSLVKDIIGTYCSRKRKTLIMVTHYENELPSCIDKFKELSPAR